MKNKCPYLHLHLECMVGGEAHIGCLDPKFHSECPYKTEHESKKKKDDSIITE